MEEPYILKKVYSTLRKSVFTKTRGKSCALQIQNRVNTAVMKSIKNTELNADLERMSLLAIRLPLVLTNVN